MKQMKNTKGITLIALVITIIVLLILAGVTIATLTGDNGILERASEARDKTEEAQEEELRRLTQAEAATHLENYEYTDSSGEKINIPAKCAVSQVEGENTLENGLVIIDANGNEWVWIEVPKSVMPDGLTFENETAYMTLETALQTYTNDYRESGSEDKWYDGCDLEEEEYTNLKQKMLKSVYENGGFYVGRYEVGSFDNPVTANDTTRKAVIQKGAYPYNYVTVSQAQELSEGFTVGEKTSSLMFGIQWDLVMKYLETKGVAESELKTNSGSLGNYRDVEFTVEVGNKYATFSNWLLGEWFDVPDNYRKPQYNSDESGVLLTTGADKRNSKMNIYDFAGNVFEWTLEKTDKNNTNYVCVNRGGSMNASESALSASSRNVFTISGNDCNLGFRPSMY